MSEAQAHKHPNYRGVWVLLMALTILVAGVACLPRSTALLIFLLLTMAIWSSLPVALYVMHLRFDRTRMRVLANGPQRLTVVAGTALPTEGVW